MQRFGSSVPGTPGSCDDLAVRAEAAQVVEELAQLEADKANKQTAEVAKRQAAAERQRAWDADKSERRDIQLDAYRARRDQREGVLTGKPPQEIRIEAHREFGRCARGAAGQGRRLCRRTRKPVPVEQEDTVARTKASRSSTPKRNITDPQSRMMPLRGGGWLQDYNCQALASSDGLIIATSVGRQLQ